MKRNSKHLLLGYEFFKDPALDRTSVETFVHASGLIAGKLGFKAFAAMGQTHSDHVREVREESFYPDTDAIFTREKHRLLMGTFADCVPLYFWTEEMVGLAHAGWRGSEKEIALKTLHAMEKAGADLRSLHALIGPCICKHCYQVSEDFHRGKEFHSSLLQIQGNPHFDLVEENYLQLKSMIQEDQIEIIPECTLESPHYESHRRDGSRSGRNSGYIAR